MDDKLRKIFEDQYGLVLRSQALKHGVTRRAIQGRLARNEWAPTFAGLYRLTGIAETWEQRVLAAVLWSSGAASHLTAARLWKLDLDVNDDAPIEVVTRRMHHHTSDTVTVHRSRAITRADLTHRRGIRVTRLGMTLVHLAQTLEPNPLEIAIDCAIRNRDGLLDWLQAWLEKNPLRGVKGAHLLRHFVRVRAHGTFDSKLEVLMKQLMDATAVPAPTHLHYPIHDPFEMNLDFVWEPQRVALQTYGIKDHGKRKRFDLDLNQIRALASRGWTVLPATWTDVTRRADALAADLIRTLRASGVPLTGNQPALIFQPRQLELF